MPTFVWKGRTLAGETQAGEIEVAAPGRGVELAAQEADPRHLGAARRPEGFKMPKLGGGVAVSTKDLAIFTRQFATMISAGLPLVQCLDILAQAGEQAVVRRGSSAR